MGFYGTSYSVNSSKFIVSQLHTLRPRYITELTSEGDKPSRVQKAVPLSIFTRVFLLKMQFL